MLNQIKHAGTELQTLTGMEAAANDNPADVLVSVEWHDGAQAHRHAMGRAADGSTELLALVARAGACAYATASEGGLPSQVRVSLSGDDPAGRVVYRAR